MECPHCHENVPEKAECANCGVIFAKWKENREAQKTLTITETEPPPKKLKLNSGMIPIVGAIFILCGFFVGSPQSSGTKTDSITALAQSGKNNQSVLIKNTAPRLEYRIYRIDTDRGVVFSDKKPVNGRVEPIGPPVSFTKINQIETWAPYEEGEGCVWLASDGMVLSSGTIDGTLYLETPKGEMMNIISSYFESRRENPCTKLMVIRPTGRSRGATGIALIWVGSLMFIWGAVLRWALANR